MSGPPVTERVPGAMSAPADAALERRDYSIRRTSHFDMLLADDGPRLDDVGVLADALRRQS